MNYQYRHGPERASLPQTSRPYTESYPRATLASEYGWCCLCLHEDVHAVCWATWLNPVGGERVDVTVCEGHKGHPDIVPGSCREVR